MATSPTSRPQTANSEWRPSTPELPDVEREQSFIDLVRSLAIYVSAIIDLPHTFDQLRTGNAGHTIKPLTDYLTDICHHPNIVSALLVLKWHYSSLEPDDRGILQARAFACEIVAWRFLAHLSDRDLLDYLLYELPKPKQAPSRSEESNRDGMNGFHDSDESDEATRLLSRPISPSRLLPPQSYRSRLESNEDSSDDEDDPTLPFAGLNALEIAAIADAKKFLSQRSVQKIVNSIWCGDIVFWDSLNVHTRKKAQRYNKWKSDPWSRLRVPLYQKVFEAIFFASFLALYYAVLIERNPDRITPLEILLYIWIAAFACDEFGEFRDAGSLFYRTDIWNLWDLGIILVGVAFLITRIVGLSKGDADAIDLSFDILSLEALFLVPRLCSMLSLHPYFGTLIPCLKEMTKDFIKFLGIVLILYFGFLTCFAMLARQDFSAHEIAWTLIYVFFGSSYMGLDISSKISKALGPPLMVIFVCMTNILLVTSLISLLTNSLTKVLDHAREEYLFQYSIFVLEASASRKLTYFLPPMNLIPLILFRPLRLFVPRDRLRSGRIMLLKLTHMPYIAAIYAYESLYRLWHRLEDDQSWHFSQHSHPEHQTKTTTNKASRAGKSRKPPTLAALGSKSEVSLVHSSSVARQWGQQRVTQEQSSSKTHTTAELGELKQMIAKLSRQVDELSARIDRQQPVQED